METLTLLKANIRSQKGSFASVILLTLIIAMSVTTILSIEKSTLAGVDYAHELCSTPDLEVFYVAHNLTDNIIENVEKDSRVGNIRTVDCIIIETAKMGNEEYRNAMCLYKADENVRILNDNLSGIAENAPRLQKGECYIPQGLLTDLGGKVGQTITFETLVGNYDFTVKGTLLAPMMGSAQIGWKAYCIGEEDFEKIFSAIKAEERENHYGLGKILEATKAESCNLTNNEFRRQLNMDTGITNFAFGSITRDMSVYYTTLFVTVISSILLVFAVLLLIIVVIVTIHSISVEIEMEYVTFGVLKSQGFDKNKIRMLFLAQYMLAEIIGAAIGTALSIPLVRVASNVFVTVTAIPSVVSIPVGIIALIIAALFAVTVVSVLFITEKVGKISPVRAISGAKREIYFDSRINLPISKNMLSPSLAVRQFTSAKRRYIGTFIIVVLLVFFMTTVTMLANTVNSRTALESMGAMVTEIQVSPKQKILDSDFAKIEEEIETFSPIRKSYYSNNSYFSFEGEEMMGCVYKDPSVFPMLKGRAPTYDNEIAVTPALLDEFKLKIGDEVTIGRQNEKKKYIIVGTVQIMNDSGRCFLTSYAAAERIGYDYFLWGSYSLLNGEDDNLNKEIANSLNKKFGNIIEARTSSGFIDNSTDTAIKAMQMIIYVFSILFALIVVQMVCSKAFVQERTDIGIYKAIGFGTSNLRLQFAFRFLTIALIGAAAGGVMSYFLSGKVLSTLLRSIGISSFNTDTEFSSFAFPIVIICVSFSLFAYLASAKIRKVRIRELVTE